jgi:DNA mismatch endonuclease (patch repair protein)
MMSDRISPEKRSWNMSRVRNADTSIEVKVRKWLFHEGFRFRKNVKTLPGKPDVVLPKYKAVIFIHGCFWHRHPNCKRATTPETREDFWITKFNRNICNDQKHILELNQLGWKVIVLWECEINKNFDETVQMLKTQIRSEVETL